MRGKQSRLVHPAITIKVSGKLFEGHLAYLHQLVRSAVECNLWPMLNLKDLVELDRAAVLYLINGEGRDFGIVFCPSLVQEWMDRERAAKAA